MAYCEHTGLNLLSSFSFYTPLDKLSATIFCYQLGIKLYNCYKKYSYILIMS